VTKDPIRKSQANPDDSLLVLIDFFKFLDGSYDDMLKDPSVEIVYAGNVHSFRRETGEKCLKANKHVLLEKPFACSVADGEYLMGLAKERNLFIMEV
jgi:predicted dehydrogenase